MLRAHHFNVDDLVKSHGDTGKIEKEWLESIVSKMKQEGILSKGHLAETLDIIKELENIDPESDEQLSEHLASIKPGLEKHPQFTADTSIVQICFEILYAFYLKEMAKQETPDPIRELAISVGTYLNLLQQKAKLVKGA